MLAVKSLHHAGVVELLANLLLALEALQQNRVGLHLRMGHLQRDQLAAVQVRRPVERRHAAVGNGRLKPVVVQRVSGFERLHEFRLHVHLDSFMGRVRNPQGKSQFDSPRLRKLPPTTKRVLPRIYIRIVNRFTCGSCQGAGQQHLPPSPQPAGFVPGIFVIGICNAFCSSITLPSGCLHGLPSRAPWPLIPRPPPSAKDRNKPAQETGFLNRNIQVRGITYRFQVYLPEDWRATTTSSGPSFSFSMAAANGAAKACGKPKSACPQEVRDHPERWPFIIVMPQCPQDAYWTDPASMEMAIAALDRETAEFNGDPDRTYLTGLSLGGYGAWELARLYPHRWAAVAIVSSGIFWSYAPDRWTRAYTPAR